VSEHLDLDALADLLAGEGTGEAHVETCPDCAGRLDELAAAEVELAASLALLPPPELPPGLADRIAAALSAEPPREVTAGSRRLGTVPAGAGNAPAAAASAAGPTAAAAGGRATTVTPMARRRRRGSPAWLPSVAAAAVIVAGAGLGVAVLGGDGGDLESTAGSGADSSEDSAATAGPARNESGIDYSDPAAVSAVLPAVLAGEADASRQPRATDEGASPASADDPLAPLREPAGLASCLLALLPPEEPDVRPLALDYASYGQTPALAVALPDPDPSKVAIYVVGAGCSQTADSLLFFTRLPRP
jgi:hypothetical protein